VRQLTTRTTPLPRRAPPTLETPAILINAYSY
jgi:hypothetical protein